MAADSFDWQQCLAILSHDQSNDATCTLPFSQVSSESLSRRTASADGYLGVQLQAAKQSFRRHRGL